MIKNYANYMKMLNDVKQKVCGRMSLYYWMNQEATYVDFTIIALRNVSILSNLMLSINSKLGMF